MTNQKCKCLDKIEASINKQFGDSAFLELKTTLNFTTGKSGRSLSPLYFKFKPKNKDGTEGLKYDRKHILFTNCPFCGKKY